jgi:hypothetical protein
MVAITASLTASKIAPLDYNTMDKHIRAMA